MARRQSKPWEDFTDSICPVHKLTVVREPQPKGGTATKCPKYHDGCRYSVWKDKKTGRSRVPVIDHAPPGTGLACGSANDCTRHRGHEGPHRNNYNGREWP